MALALVGASSAALLGLRSRHAATGSAAAPAPTKTAVANAPASTFAEPRWTRHDGVTVTIEGGGLLRETEPYLVPDDAKRPVTFILHGLCAEQTWMCDWLQHGDVLSPQWQLCPRAPVDCGNGGAHWTADGDTTVDLLSRALATTRARHPGRVGDRIVLAGMSQGAYAIANALRTLAKQKPPRLSLAGVVLQGARVSVSAADAKALGIRVVLCAGERDGAAPSMKKLAASLKAQGVDARYFSFGNVGHFIPVSTAKAMSELIDWARGG